MTKFFHHTRWIAAIATLALAGCASDVKLDEAPVETRTPSTSAAGSGTGAPGAGGTAPGAGSGAAQNQVTAVDLTKSGPATAAAPAARVVYFDYDSYLVKDEYRALIDAHARALSANKGRRMLIEGHTDERGGREYNLALGQKRAEAVAKALMLLGVPPSQLEAVSLGEERPAVDGQTEEAWAKNRRAELKDR